MITIGYGDIYPVTIYERGFVILITLISCGVFAYSVNQIGKNHYKLLCIKLLSNQGKMGKKDLTDLTHICNTRFTLFCALRSLDPHLNLKFQLIEVKNGVTYQTSTTSRCAAWFANASAKIFRVLALRQRRKRWQTMWWYDRFPV